MKLIVISICKDEAATIGQVLDQVPAKIPGISRIEKWVIDDGSTDETAHIAKQHGANVISDGAQKRLAFRFREATELALAQGADVMVNIDGDLQFNPKDIPELVKPIVEGRADFVSASRFIGKNGGKAERPENMSRGKYLGNRLGARVISHLSGQRFSDVTCGFRAYARPALLALNINSAFTYTQESFQVLAMKKLRIVSVPITVKYYPERKSRVVRSFRHYIFGSALNILRAYRDYAPLKFFGELGVVFFVPGLILSIFTIIHWFNTGVFSPYKAVGLAGLYLITMALFVWALGIVADMLDRLLNNQEKILEMMKKERYEPKPKNKTD